MMGNQKGLSTAVLFAFVTLLSCCSLASSFAFLPRVSRTNDAVVIDFTGVGYAPSHYGKTLYGQIVNPGFVPLPSVYGWPLSFGYPSLTAPSAKQFDGEEYLDEDLTVKQAAKCGAGPTAMPARRALATERVAGGTDAKKGAWPFMVALRKADGSLFCSGTLLGESKVLLAAQCLEKMSTFEMNGVTILVGMSSSDFSDLQATRRIGKVALHNLYNSFTFANDIAIITLDQPVILSRTIATACLPQQNADSDQFAGQDAMILGWGTTTAATPAAKLQQGKTAIDTNQNCRGDTNFGKYVSDNTICTTLATAPFTCVTDVGGPVVTFPGTPGAWTVVGINSFTKDCASGGLKTRVSAYVDWINKY